MGDHERTQLAAALRRAFDAVRKGAEASAAPTSLGNTAKPPAQDERGDVPALAVTQVDAVEATTRAEHATAPASLPQGDVPESTDASTSSRAHGIGFSAELLDAILAGRKTETRRPIRPQPAEPASVVRPIAPGDRLWVREAWARSPVGYVYARDTAARSIRFTPARFMPRDAARLFLRVMDVRVERLHAIDESAAIAEGFAASPLGNIRARESFLATWDTFYGDGEFRAAGDPLVWVIAFEIDS